MSDFHQGGIAYLAKPISEQNYRHLRSILTKLLELPQWSHRKFDIDAKFEYNIQATNNFIKSNFGITDINNAHAAACAEYAARKSSGYRGGRPKGARNRPKVQHSDSVLDDVITETEVTEAPKAEQQPQEHNKPNQDMSAYLLKTEFFQHKDSVQKAFDHAAQEIGEAYKRLDAHDAALNNQYRVITDIQEELRRTRVVTVEVKPFEQPVISVGMQHMRFPDLLGLCTAAVNDPSEPLNVWLYGPAGTGKTTAAKHIAKALQMAFGREFPFYALSKLSTEYQVLGYQDAGGKYIPTMFRKCYEHGGVIILDEIDSWSPNAMTALNGALANGYCAFPDGMIERHKDCIIIAGANTVGTGGTIEYVGRMKQDAASLDRFLMLHWPIDEALEAALCNNTDWLNRVRHVRAKVAQIGLKDVMITPRAAIKGAHMLRNGIPQALVEENLLKRGMTEAQWKQVN